MWEIHVGVRVLYPGKMAWTNGAEDKEESIGTTGMDTYLPLVTEPIRLAIKNARFTMKGKG